MCMLSSVLRFHVACVYSFSSLLQSCRNEERSALLQFKESFIINSSISIVGAYPKVLSWKLGGKINNCCSWDGVECDEKAGHVIGLDLSSSCLYGSINSSISLFRLVHLQSLNLANNYFNYSQVPSAIRNSPRLRYLNLSDSVFSGEVPSEVSQLSKVSTLDLSVNLDRSPVRLLRPSACCAAPHLRLLGCSSQTGCNPCIPLCRKPTLHRHVTFPSSTSHHSNTTKWRCCTTTSELQMLVEVNDQRSSDSASVPTHKVTVHDRQRGVVHEFFVSELNYLYLRGNELTGPVPPTVGNLSRLVNIELTENNLCGPFPESFYSIINLRNLCLDSNSLSGVVEFDRLLKLENVIQIFVSMNRLELVTAARSANATLPQLRVLGLRSCNIRVSKFPKIPTKIAMVGRFGKQIAWGSTKIVMEHKH
ncbi:hypothetical protein ACLB2K_073931 [Fragaria x ananassa]